MKWRNQWNPEWRRRFALFPRQIEGGVTVWLDFYETRYVAKEPTVGNGFCFGVWETRLPASGGDR